jgi:hypothetical protein
MGHINKNIFTGALALIMLGDSLAVMAALPGGAGSIDAAKAHLFHLLGLLVLIATGCLVYTLIMAGFYALTLFGRVMWPRQVECVEEALKNNLPRCFVLGLVNLLAFLILLLLLKGTGLAGIIILLFFTLALYFGIKGAPAIPGLLGERVSLLLNMNAPPSHKLALGTAVIAGLGLIPPAGWLLIVFIKISVFGAAILTTFAVRKSPHAPSAAGIRT